MERNFSCHLILTVIAFILIHMGFFNRAQAEEQKIYKDRNGYFLAVPPPGWTQKDYPSETVRSKVAFVNSSEPRVLIRIIAGPNPRKSYTLDDLFEENKQKIANILRPKFPRVKTSIEKTRVGDRDAIVWVNSGPPLGVQRIVFYVESNNWWQVAFNTETKKQSENYRNTFDRFLNSFVLLDKTREFSEKEAKAAIVSKYRRLAELFEKMGQITEAITFLNEGISLIPDSEELLQYKKRLEAKN